MVVWRAAHGICCKRQVPVLGGHCSECESPTVFDEVLGYDS
jgi:hypothetical protein